MNNFKHRVLRIEPNNTNVNVQYNGGFLPDIIHPMLSASGNLFKCHEEVLYMQPLIPPKRFNIFPPITGGCSEGLGVF